MIHKYSMNGYNIVMDTNSGAVHIFSDAAFAILDYLDDYVPDEPPEYMIDKLKNRFDEKMLRESYAEIRELYKKGQLYSKDDYAPFAKMLKGAPIKSMCLTFRTTATYAAGTALQLREISAELVC